jgi:hypothetical protein
MYVTSDNDIHHDRRITNRRKSAGIVVIFTELHAAIADKVRIEILLTQPALLPLVAQLGLGPHQYPDDPRAKSDAYERLQANGSR